MTDHDLVNRTMKEGQRSIADPVGPNPFNGEPAIEALREVQDYKRKQETIAVQAGPRLANLDRDRAIHLRWTLRDIIIAIGENCRLSVQEWASNEGHGAID